MKAENKVYSQWARCSGRYRCPFVLVKAALSPPEGVPDACPMPPDHEISTTVVLQPLADQSRQSARPTR